MFKRFLKASMLLVAGAAFAASAPAALAQDELHVVRSPIWVKTPVAVDLLSLYPKKARKQNKEGKVTIRCGVKADGYVEKCTVLEEAPLGYGFGDAAIKMARIFRMRPQEADGTPTAGGVVNIPISFRLS